MSWSLINNKQQKNQRCSAWKANVKKCMIGLWLIKFKWSWVEVAYCGWWIAMVNQSQNSLRVECVNTSKHGINITRTRTRDKRLHFSNKIIKMTPEGISGVVLVIFLLHWCRMASSPRPGRREALLSFKGVPGMGEHAIWWCFGPLNACKH